MKMVTCHPPFPAKYANVDLFAAVGRTLDGAPVMDCTPSTQISSEIRKKTQKFHSFFDGLKAEISTRSKNMKRRRWGEISNDFDMQMSGCFWLFLDRKKRLPSLCSWVAAARPLPYSRTSTQIWHITFPSGGEGGGRGSLTIYFHLAKRESSAGNNEPATDKSRLNFATLMSWFQMDEFNERLRLP